MLYLYKYEIEEIGNAMANNFLLRQGIYAKNMNIKAFAADFLNLKITYVELFNCKQPAGFTTYRDIKLRLNVGGVCEIVRICANTIVLDAKLRDEQSGFKNFTIAHECAHHIIHRIENDENIGNLSKSFYGQFHEMPRPSVSIVRWIEWQANALASVLLMPKSIIHKAMQLYEHPEKFISYTYDKITERDSAYIERIAKMLGVSYTALKIRLYQLNLIEDKTKRKAI